ncbi:hypothetical protein J4E93_002291 [Alternaria ventricosa]|uniref:uncharacterized protein n=1 Tax=Alternaria ventricosa TaxID=1187951 RepID=UPI0020C38911|nr:uncharacterized protein J4E93_002291 [Alternaria ventricosa]KAI4652094.1 hypothetical protein J4E93_002291 [Alternaria ventricosa]
MDSHQSTDLFATTTSYGSVEPATDVVDGVHKLAIEEEDDYEVHEDEFVTPEEIDPDDSDDSDAFEYRVDLATQELQHAHKPVYTRALLERVKCWADQIRGELTLPSNKQVLNHVDASGLSKKKYRVWNRDNGVNANTIQVDYLSRVEMHPDFQSQYGNHSEQIKTLRRYNKDHKQDCIDTPYTFTTFDRCFFNEHKNLAKMRTYWSTIQHTKRLWIASSAKRQLIEAFQETAKTCAPITQVVCFGIGALNLKKNWYHSAIQYMAIFSIIQALNQYYHQADPARPLIKLVLQDPNYETKDHEILRTLFNNNDNISFVSDPDGFLAIDAGTLVVTAYIPFWMPLVQIIADLFSENPGQGPAAILCDAMEVDTEKREYSFSERASPAVAQHLTNQYEREEDMFGHHGLEDELMADAYGADWVENNRFYWLNNMDLWVRKSGEIQERHVQDQ